MTLIENRSQKTAVAVVYIAAMFMSVLDTTIVTTALPAIGREFDVPPISVSAVPTAYLLALTVVIPLAGWLGEKIGGKRAMLASIGIFTLASAACGLATDLPELIVFSVLQGVGGAVMIPVGLALLFRTFPPVERVRVSGILALFTALGPALGPVLGGALITYVTWRLVFEVNVPIGVVVVVWAAVALDADRRPDPGRLDLAGFLLAAVGIGGLVTALSEGPRLGWGHPVVIAAAIAGIVGVAALLRIERRADRPLIDVRLFRDRLFAAATSLYALGSVSYIGTLFVVALFVQEALRLSALDAGLAGLSAAIGVMLGGQIVTRALYRRLGPRRVIAGGLILLAATLAALALAGRSTDAWLIRLDLVGAGIGVAAVFVPAQTISMTTIEPDRLSSASPLFSAGKQLGSAVGVAFLTAIAAAVAGGSGARGAAGALPYHAAFIVAALVALAGVPIALRIRDADAASTMPARG